MSIIRFEPFREFVALQDRVNRLVGDLYVRNNEDLASGGAWVPVVDIYETGAHDVVIKAELPDMAREDIEVTVERETLTLRGTRKPPTDVKEEQFRRVERSYGPFSRSFVLPTTVDATKVSADYKDGVLTVKLPYREEARPRTIKVEVAA